MAKIKSIAVIAAKWASVTPMRSGDYAEGIANPERSWETATKAAEGAWASGVQAAVTRHSFTKGVASAGDTKWSRKASTIGVARWGPGVAEAEGEYAAGFGPYRDAIEKCVLPPRFARRDPRNMARVNAIIACLVAQKEKTG